MWAGNYVAPGVAIAGLGMTYYAYALMKHESNLDEEDKHYISYVLEMMGQDSQEQDQDKESRPSDNDLTSNRVFVSMKSAATGNTESDLSKCSKSPHRTSEAMSSDGFIRITPSFRSEKSSQSQHCYKYLKRKFDKIQEQRKNEGLNAALLSHSLHSGPGNRDKLSFEDVKMQAYVSTEPLEHALVESSRSCGPDLMQEPPQPQETVTISPVPMPDSTHFERFFCGENESRIAKGSGGTDEMLIASACDPRELVNTFSECGRKDFDVDYYYDSSCNVARSDSAITVIDAKTVSNEACRSTAASASASLESIQIIGKLSTRRLLRASRHSLSLCQLELSSGKLGMICKHTENTWNRHRNGRHALPVPVLDFEWTYPCIWGGGFVDVNRDRELASVIVLRMKRGGSTQFIMPPVITDTTSVASTCWTNSMNSTTTSHFVSTTPFLNSCSNLKIHELAVEELLKESQESEKNYKSISRTQSLPQVLIKDDLHEIVWEKNSTDPSHFRAKRSFHLALTILYQRIPVQILLSIVVAISLWLFLQFLAAQSQRKTAFDWHW